MCIVDGDDVKVVGWYIFNLLCEKIFSCGNQVLLFGGCDICCCFVEVLCGVCYVGMYFNEYQGVGCIVYYQIDFIVFVVIIVIDYG